MQNSEMTVESVAQFMKNVNRIRFNSMNIDRNVLQDKVEKSWKYVRSKSCPQFEPETDEIDGYSNDVVGDEHFDPNNPKEKMFSISMDATSQGTEHNHPAGGSMSQPAMVTTTLATMTTKVVYSRSTSMAYGQQLESKTRPAMPLMPYEELFPFALPNAAYLGSYSDCTRQTVAPSAGKLGHHVSNGKPFLL